MPNFEVFLHNYNEEEVLQYLFSYLKQLTCNLKPHELLEHNTKMMYEKTSIHVSLFFQEEQASDFNRLSILLVNEGFISNEQKPYLLNFFQYQS